jgi:exosortase A-associated hydrolase 1
MSVIHEQPVVIQGRLPSPMLGVLTSPGKGLNSPVTGMVIVNGGAQYRVGAHRLFVQLARHLASKGHAVLRFDLPGQGDSPGEPVGFEVTAPHIGAAVDALHQHLPHLQNIALFGLCDGASACLLYLHAQPDPRITHLVLLNPWVRSEASLAKAQIQHYYRRRLLMPDFWKKLFKGGVGWAALRELAHKATLARQKPLDRLGPGFQDRMGMAVRDFKGELLVLLSECDQTAQEFQAHVARATHWRLWDQHPGLTVQALPEADHTCSTLAAKTAAIQATYRVLNDSPKI